MRRREFLQSLVALGGWSALEQSSVLAQYMPVAHPEIKRVLVMCKCHFDAGFIDTQRAVVSWYFDDYFPQAIRLAQNQRAIGGHPYVWTTGSWLLYEYLEQASPAARQEMEQSIARGDIAWHALPFSWQTEFIDPTMIAGSLALSESLDRRFGTKTTGAKMTDVTGHTRGLVAPLAEGGVTFLDIGANGATVVADVPPLFCWRDSKGAELTVMFHNGYGSVMRVPGTDLAIAVMVKSDNGGPHDPSEIVAMYSELGKRFPNATLTAASLTTIADAVAPYRKQLPVVTQEIGDSWIYGVPSDPVKVARYLELARLRQRWIAQGKLRVGDATDVALLRHVLLEPEHTWGTDVKTWLDFDHYRTQDLAKVFDTPNYKTVEFSWKEKRQDIWDGVAALPAVLRGEAEDAMRRLTPQEPTMAEGSRISAAREIETPHYILKFDEKTGAICRLQNRKTGKEWASSDHPLALFSYQTLSAQDYKDFFARYLMIKAEWVNFDLGKPKIDQFGAKSQEWLPTLTDLRQEKTAEGQRVLASLKIHDDAAIQFGRAAFPARMYLEVMLPDREPIVEVNFYWFEKPAMRLPESLWLTFRPVVQDPRGWSMVKSGERVSPLDVVAGGGRQMHAVSEFRYEEPGVTFVVEPLDAPVMAIGRRSPLNFSKEQPDVSPGMHSNLFNNAWGTNYVMWFGENMRFRYRLRA